MKRTGLARLEARCGPVLLLLNLLLSCTACGVQNDIAEDMNASACPECATALWLTAENHGVSGEGWGQADCFACHPRVKLHAATANPYLDLGPIREMVARQGLEACRTCHGDNGT